MPDSQLEQEIETIPVFDEEQLEVIPIYGDDQVETIPVFDEIEVVQEAPLPAKDLAPLPESPPERPEVDMPIGALLPPALAEGRELRPLPESPTPADLEQPAAALEVRKAADDEDDGALYGVRDDNDITANHSLTGLLASYLLDVDGITALAYPTQGVAALVASEEELFVLDLKTRVCRRFGRPMHGAPVHCLIMSPDGRRALSGDADGGLMLWEIAGARPVGWLDGHRDGVTTVDFSPDGGHAASGGLGGIVRLWDCATGVSRLLEQGQLNQAVTCVRFAPDGRLLLGLGERGRARLWNVADGTLALPLESGAEQLHSAGFQQSFNEDGSALNSAVVASSAKRFKVCKWSLADGKRDPCFNGFSRRHPRVRRTWTTPDGRCLLVLTYTLERGPRKEFDMTEGPDSLRATFLNPMPWALRHTEFYFNNTWTLNQRAIFHLERWDVAYENALSFVDLGKTPPAALACASDGRRVLAGYPSGAVRLLAL